MVNKIFAKNMKSPESNDLSDRFVRLEIAYTVFTLNIRTP